MISAEVSRNTLCRRLHFGSQELQGLSCWNDGAGVPAGASPRPGHPPHTVRPWMWPNVQTRAVQGPCARRGMDDVRVQSCYSVVGPHTSKEQVSAHARRGRVGVIVVRRLEGEVSHRGLTGLFTPDLKHRGARMVGRGCAWATEPCPEQCACAKQSAKPCYGCKTRCSERLTCVAQQALNGVSTSFSPGLPKIC